MPEGRIRFIFEAIDRTSRVIRSIQERVLNLSRTTETQLPTIADKGIVPLLRELNKLEKKWESLESNATRSSVYMRSKLESDMLRIQRALQSLETVGLTNAGVFFNRWDDYSRMYSVTVRDRIIRMTRRIGPIFSWIGYQMEEFGDRAGRVAWTFTWATLSMLGVMWNLQWTVRMFLDPMKKALNELMNFSDAAFSVATWLGYANAMGLDFAKQLGGIGKVTKDVVQSGIFLQAVLAGISASFLIAFARALKIKDVRDAIIDAINALIRVITKPEIIKAIAGIIEGFARMAETIIPKTYEMMPAIEKFLNTFLDAIPKLTMFMGVIVGLIPGLGGLKRLFVAMSNTMERQGTTWEKLGAALATLSALLIALQPILLPLMTILSMISMIIVHVMIVTRALSGAWNLLGGVAERLGLSVGELIGRFLGVVGGIISVVQGVWTLIHGGNVLKGVVEILIGLAMIIVALLGGWVAAAIMAVVAAVKSVIDYFGWWDEITRKLTAALRWLEGVLRPVIDMLRGAEGLFTRVASVFGFGGSGSPQSMTVYQNVSIGSIEKLADVDEVLRRLANSTWAQTGGSY